MRITVAIIWALFLLCHGFVLAREGESLQGTLTGTVTDKKTGEPLPGAIIYFPDLKTGTTTDADGRYAIKNLPQSRLLLQISCISYRTMLETVDLSSTTALDFGLEYVATEINEVVVTGVSRSTEQKRNPTPVTIVPRLALLQGTSGNIIDAIAGQPGISQVTTGTGISKPVIRGLGSNRVVIVNDGIRQEGQQWGDEHGIEIDEYSVNRVEILKGPASIAYGSDALAGVINMLPAPFLSPGELRGNLILNYQTNNGLFGVSGNMAGNRKGLVWGLRYSHKIAHAYYNRYDGYVFNSGFRESGVGIMSGLVRPWGYSNLSFSAYTLTPGLVEGERDSLTGRFTHPVAINDTNAITSIASGDDLRTYTQLVPYQKVHHYKITLNSNFILGNSSLRTIIGFQQNQRQEYGDVLNPGQYGLFFQLNTIHYDFQYRLPDIRKYSVSLGINGMQQSSKNKGEEFLIPEYNLFDAGAFLVVRKTINHFDLGGGLRYDARIEDARDLYTDPSGGELPGPAPGSVHRFTAFHTTFSSISGSIGFTWQLSGAMVNKLNLSRGFRAPNIAELGSNGVHEGTLRYELGDPDLKPETSLQCDYTFGINGEHISAEANVFYNQISHYVFSQKLNSTLGGDSLIQGYGTFRFVQGDAYLAGGEIRIDIHPHPLDWIHFENTISFVEGRQKDQPDSARYLPLIPPARLNSTLRIDIKKASDAFSNVYFQFGSELFFRQDKFFSAYGTETVTPGYMLLNLGLGTNFTKRERTICSLYLGVNNLTDKAYQSHLSRLKYTDRNNLSGRTGIFNMGRNFSFKFVIPVNISYLTRASSMITG